MKKMIQKITQNNWNFWTVNLIMRPKKIVNQLSDFPVRRTGSYRHKKSTAFKQVVHLSSIHLGSFDCNYILPSSILCVLYKYVIHTSSGCNACMNRPIHHFGNLLSRIFSFWGELSVYVLTCLLHNDAENTVQVHLISDFKVLIVL